MRAAHNKFDVRAIQASWQAFDAKVHRASMRDCF